MLKVSFVRHLNFKKDPLSDLPGIGRVHDKGEEVRLLGLGPRKHKALEVRVKVTQDDLSEMIQDLECIPLLGKEEGSILGVLHCLDNGEPVLCDLVCIEEQQTGCLPVCDYAGK